MAVYTNVTESDVQQFFESYDLGELQNLQGITAGIENTNYFVDTQNGRYVLTIFEKRVDISDIPYFISVMNHMNANNINCPQVIADKNGETLNDIVGKKAIIISFLNGADVSGNINTNYTQQAGEKLANMHNAVNSFNQNRKNALALNGQIELFESFKNDLDEQYFDIINNEIEYQKSKSFGNLPSGACHLDFFVDNVFFENDKISGVIDFYFTATESFAYDLAITINAWCYENFEKMDLQLAKSMLAGYEKNRSLSDAEKNALPDLLRLSCLRFLLTRSYDFINTPDDADVVVKDPMEYLQKLKYCQTIKVGDLF